MCSKPRTLPQSNSREWLQGIFSSSLCCAVQSWSETLKESLDNGIVATLGGGEEHNFA